MHWLIIGGNLQNKGAELMLSAVTNEIKKRKPNSHIVVNGSTGEQSKLKEKGLMILDFALPHIGSNWKFIPIVKFGNIVKYIKKKYRGEISLDTVDIVLDISGYAFGDYWGIQPIKNVFFLIRFLKRKGIKYIFLPQAFGPFETKLSVKLMKSAITDSFACFARDETSYNYLVDLHTSSENIYLCPDITLKNNIIHIQPQSYISFIPNERMLDKGGEFWRKAYIPLVIESLKFITENSSFEIKIIIHDRSKGDFDIAQHISKNFRNKIEVIDLLDPQEIKIIIAKSQFLISSRYHGLAVGLSNNVPSIAIGWSHKYFHLLNEYNLSEFVVSQEADVNNLHKLIKQLMDDYERAKIRQKILEMNIQIQQKIDTMWDKIMTLSDSKLIN